MSKFAFQTNLVGRSVRLKTHEEMWPGNTDIVPRVGAVLKTYGGKTGEIVTVARSEEDGTTYALVVDGEVLENVYSSLFTVLPVK